MMAQEQMGTNLPWKKVEIWKGIRRSQRPHPHQRSEDLEQSCTKSTRKTKELFQQVIWPAHDRVDYAPSIKLKLQDLIIPKL